MHDLSTAVDGLGEAREHARGVGGRVDAEHEEGVARLPVLEVGVPLPVARDAVSPRPEPSWHMFEQSGRLFRPELPREQLVEERRLVAQAAGGVERGLVGGVQGGEVLAIMRNASFHEIGT